MPRHVITAPGDLSTLAKLDGPLVYLAGPIQGTVNWQTEAVKILGDLAPELHVATPRARSFAGGAEQYLVWEQAAIARAALDGVVLFWLSRETKHHCDRTYAANARFELGEWSAKASAGLARLVVGMERGFPGGTYLQRRLTLSFPQIPLCRTLRQTCAVTVERATASIAVVPRPLAELFVPQSFGGTNNG